MVNFTKIIFNTKLLWKYQSFAMTQNLFRLHWHYKTNAFYLVICILKVRLLIWKFLCKNVPATVKPNSTFCVHTTSDRAHGDNIYACYPYPPHLNQGPMVLFLHKTKKNPSSLIFAKRHMGHDAKSKWRKRLFLSNTPHCFHLITKFPGSICFTSPNNFTSCSRVSSVQLESRQ